MKVSCTSFQAIYHQSCTRGKNHVDCRNHARPPCITVWWQRSSLLGHGETDVFCAWETRIDPPVSMSPTVVYGLFGPRTMYPNFSKVRPNCIVFAAGGYLGDYIASFPAKSREYDSNCANSGHSISLLSITYLYKWLIVVLK